MKFNLVKSFQKWYTGDVFPDLGSSRKAYFEKHAKDVEANRDYWMQQAFNAGAQAMANETRCILGDYAAACSGLEPEFISPDEVFDRAENNLESYYQQIFTK